MLHCIMVFMDLPNGHVELQSGHVAQVRLGASEKTLHYSLLGD